MSENIFLESVKKIAESMGRIIISGFVHGVLNTDNFNVTGGQNQSSLEWDFVIGYGDPVGGEAVSYNLSLIHI